MLREVCATALQDLDALNYDRLDVEARLDWHLLRNEVRRTLDHVAQDEKKRLEVSDLVPFMGSVIGLVERRRSVERPNYAADAQAVDALAKQAQALSSAIDDREKVGRPAAVRASRMVREAAELLKKWFEFYDGYDPEFSWWMRTPHQDAQAALEGYAAALTEKLAGLAQDDKTTIVGDPIGREALLDDSDVAP